ncbi:uncharacterized protein LOC142398809 [Odontesthes bonariensis]|uniref:uncharacterized protein LOC142398809 n=1 Tax=Odontesthes bonariensis TaxID=219752 RepID=UPI003F586A8F
MGEPKCTELDLNNFESDGAERSRCVLTSPRSLESCARLGVKPVQLLIKSLNELIAEQRDLPFGTMRVMHESYQKERLKLLQMCREERERIIQVAGGKIASSMEVLPDAKVKDHSSDKQMTGPVPYADLCFKETPASRSTCSLADRGDPDRSRVSSFSLGDLRHFPATEIKLQRLTANINRKMCVTVSERDRKIAALMLVKHQEEQDRLKLSQQEELRRQEEHRRAEDQRAQAEKKRRKKLKQSMKCWNKELEARRTLRERQKQEKAAQLEQEALLQEDRWRRLKEEVEVQRREKIEGAQKEAEERKRYQEKLLREKEEVEKKLREREMQVAVEKEERAWRSRVLQEQRERRRLQEENHRDLLRHILLKKQMEQQVEEEEQQMRSTLERKLQRSSEKRAQAVEAQLRELQERAAHEEGQIQRAQLRAKLQRIQQHTHKRILVQLSQHRMERAALHATATHRSRAQQTHQHNKHRQSCHHRLREEIQREEEAMMKVRENYVSVKEWKRERLRRQREQIQEEAQRLAQASFHMRERVRQQTHSRTFDQMALEAQLTASMNRMKL